MKRGDVDRALNDYSEALRLKPGDIDALIARGGAYADRKDFDRGLADLNEAVRLDPKSSDAFFKRGYLFGEKKEHDRAIADYTTVLRLDNGKNSAALHNRGSSHYEKKDYDRAIADFSAALKLTPEQRLLKAMDLKPCGLLMALRAAKVDLIVVGGVAAGVHGSARFVCLRFGIGNGGEDHTIEEIGGSVGLTPERVRQILSKALGKMRKRRVAEIRQGGP